MGARVCGKIGIAGPQPMNDLSPVGVVKRNSPQVGGFSLMISLPRSEFGFFPKTPLFPEAWDAGTFGCRLGKAPGDPWLLLCRRDRRSAWWVCSSSSGLPRGHYFSDYLRWGKKPKLYKKLEK